MAASELVNWELARAAAERLAPRGPEMPLATARGVVAELRELAYLAEEPVARASGLRAPGAGAFVIDRKEWIASNLGAMRIVLAGLDRKGSTPPLAASAAGVQLGAILGWLSGKVLGQYEAITAGGAGRLLLVAPNIVHVEQVLRLPSRDFRLWVCLHEETHRVQFGAVPWLGGYLVEQVDELIAGANTSASQSLTRLVGAARSLLRPNGPNDAHGSGSLVEALQTPAQRVTFDRLTALLSLLEGHAEYVMDAVGPEVVPSVAVIRRSFDARRASPSALESVLRKLLGMDAKLRQYTEGAAFVRTAVDRLGVEGFNRVWASPQTLPTRAEILRPEAWIARMAQAA